VYSTDLAYIHDVGFSDFANGVAPDVMKVLRANGITDGKIVDVGCGSGTLARHLARAGYEVIGFDISRAMIRLARTNVPDARFGVRSLLVARLPRCAAVLAMGEVITYVPAAAGRVALPRPLRDFFARVHASLQPGGLFMFDFIESGAARTYPAKTRRGSDWVLAAQAQLDRSGRSLRRRIVTIRKLAHGHRHTQELHRVRIYQRSAVADALAGAGFRSKMSRSYGRYRLLPGSVAVVAHKR
jgi:SAM-dependent methyltransferase